MLRSFLLFHQYARQPTVSAEEQGLRLGGAPVTYDIVLDSTEEPQRLSQRAVLERAYVWSARVARLPSATPVIIWNVMPDKPTG